MVNTNWPKIKINKLHSLIKVAKLIYYDIYLKIKDNIKDNLNSILLENN